MPCGLDVVHGSSIATGRDRFWYFWLYVTSEVDVGEMCERIKARYLYSVCSLYILARRALKVVLEYSRLSARNVEMNSRTDAFAKVEMTDNEKPRDGIDVVCRAERK